MDKLIKDAKNVKTWDNLLDYASYISSSKNKKKNSITYF